MRKIFTVAVGIASFAIFISVQCAFADCRSENAACIKGANSPFDSVACGSLYRSCATHAAIAAQQQARQKQNTTSAVTKSSPPPLGSGRKGK